MILTKSAKDKVDIDQLVYEKINSGKLNELVLIVPTNRKVRYLKREIISNSPDQTAYHLNLETLATLSTSLFNESREFEATILSDATAVVLLNQAFTEVKLQYFNHYNKKIPRGTLELVKNVISQYKRQGINPGDLIKESELLSGSEKLKAIDIANIFSLYNDKTKELNAFELGDIYYYLINRSEEEFKSAFQSVYPGSNTIIINGFDEFTQPEIELIDKLSQLSSNSLYLSFDYYKRNPEIFSHLEMCYERLITKGFREVEDSSAGEFDEYRRRIRENLFTARITKPQKSNMKLVKIASANPVNEIENIAKEIKRLILNKEADADEICIAFNLISEHSAVIRDVFDSYGIPFNLTDRYNLSSSSPVTALINFLEILENDFYYKNIFRALSGRWIDIPGIDISNMLAVSTNLKLVAGLTHWMSTIQNVLDQMRNGFNDEDSRFLSVWQYEKALNDIIGIEELLQPFKKKQTIKNIRNNLISLISRLNLSSKLINDNSPEVEKNVKALTVFIETLDELFELLGREYGSSKTFSLSFFLGEIKTAVSFSRYNIKERHGKGVLVTSVNEIRGLRFRYLFLGGMTDGEFPTRHQPVIFFSGEHRKQGDDQRHLLEERYRFYQAMCVPEKCLYFSYPEKGDKKELSESSFLTDLEKLFIIENKNADEFRKLIYSKEELLKSFGRGDIDQSSDIINADMIKSSINIDSVRKNDPFGKSAFTGYIPDNLDDDARNILSSFTEKEFSATQLEDYAKCPFRYFIGRILSVDTIEEPAEEIEAFEIGSLIHSIFFKFYYGLKEKGITLSGCSDKEFTTAEKMLFSIAQEKVNKIKFASAMSFFEREKIFGINSKKENSILYQFLLTERNSDRGFIPEYFEYGFGSLSKSNYTSSIEVNGIKLRGKVDRIDLNKEDKTFKVVDYKLGGKKPLKDDLLLGISLQLPLYMYASKVLIEAELNGKYNPLSAEIYSLKLTHKNFGRKAISIESKRNLSDDQLIEMNERIINIAVESIQKYVKHIADGDFRLSQLENRENKVCRYCEFKSVCRIQEVN